MEGGGEVITVGKGIARSEKETTSSQGFLDED